MTTTEKRLKDLEAKIMPNDEKCYLVIGLHRDELPTCRKGRMVSLDLHECEGCEIPPEEPEGPPGQVDELRGRAPGEARERSRGGAELATIERRLRDLEERVRPGPDTRRPVEIAFMLELHKQPHEDMRLVIEAFDRMDRDRKGEPRISSWNDTPMTNLLFPFRDLTDEDLASRCSPVFDRIEAELIRQGYREEELMEPTID